MFADGPGALDGRLAFDGLVGALLGAVGSAAARAGAVGRPAAASAADAEVESFLFSIAGGAGRHSMGTHGGVESARARALASICDRLCASDWICARFGGSAGVNCRTQSRITALAWKQRATWERARRLIGACG